MEVKHFPCLSLSTRISADLLKKKLRRRKTTLCVVC